MKKTVSVCMPVALLSTQTVAGTNYCILCEATTVYPGAEMHYAVVNVYKSLEGNANIISATDGDVSRNFYFEKPERSKPFRFYFFGKAKLSLLQIQITGKTLWKPT